MATLEEINARLRDSQGSVPAAVGKAGRFISTNALKAEKAIEKIAPFTKAPIDATKKAVGTAVDVIQKPQSVGTAILSEFIKDGVQLSDISRGFKRGMSESVSPSRELGIDTSTNAGFVAGLALDIITDPATYLTFLSSSAVRIGTRTLSFAGENVYKNSIKSAVVNHKKKTGMSPTANSLKKIDFEVKHSLEKTFRSNKDKYYSRIGIGVHVPFTSTTKFFSLPTTKIFNRIGGIIDSTIGKTKTGKIVIDTTKTISENIKKYVGGAFSTTSRTAELKSPITQEVVLKLKEEVDSLNASMRVRLEAIFNSTVKEIGRKGYGDIFADAVKYSERVKNGSVDSIMAGIKDIITKDMNSGVITKERGEKILIAAAPIINASIEIRDGAVLHGRLDVQLENVWIPRELAEGYKESKITSDVQRGQVTKNRIKRRSLFSLSDETAGKETVIFKHDNNTGKRRVVNIDESSDQAKVLKKGDTFSFVSKTDVEKQKQAVILRERRKIEKQRAILDNAYAQYTANNLEFTAKINDLIKGKNSVAINSSLKSTEKVKIALDKKLDNYSLEHKIRNAKIDTEIDIEMKHKVISQSKVTRIKRNDRRAIAQAEHDSIHSGTFRRMEERRLNSDMEYLMGREKSINSFSAKARIISGKLADKLSDTLISKSYGKMSEQSIKRDIMLSDRLREVKSKISGMEFILKSKLDMIDKATGGGDVFVKDIVSRKLADRAAGAIIRNMKTASRESVDNLSEVSIFRDPLEGMVNGFLSQGAMNNMAYVFDRMLKGDLESKAMVVKDLKVFRKTKNDTFYVKPDKGFVSLYDKTGYPNVKGKQIPEEVWDAMRDHLRMLGEPELTHFLLKAYDGMTAWMKTFMLSSIAYSTVNIVTALISAGTAGMKNPKHFFDMGNIMRKSALGVKLSGKESSLMGELLTNNVLNKSLHAAEVGESVTEGLKGISWNPLNHKRGFVARGFGKIAASSDDIIRGGMYMWRRSQGDVPSQAAFVVKKYQFDYSDVTRLEKSVAKRILPFYSWSRKNIPLQISLLLSKPRYAAAQSHLETAIEPENADEIRGYMTDEQIARHPIVLPWADKYGNNYVINGVGLLPAYDLSAIVQGNTFQVISDMVTPIGKLPTELFTNKNIFFKRKLNELKGEESIFSDLLDVPYTGNDQLRNDFLGGMFNSAQAHVISTAYRPLRDLSNFFEFGKDDKKEMSARILRPLFKNATPVDVIRLKSFKKYLGEKEKKDLLKIFSRAIGKQLSGDSKAHVKNIEIATQALVDLGFSGEEVKKEYLRAVGRDARYNKLSKVIKIAMSENRKPLPSEIRQIIRDVKNSYKDKSYKRARNNVKKIIKERYDLAVK